MSELWNLSHLKPQTASVLDGETIPAMFWQAAKQRAPRVWMRQKELGLWRAWTWQETATRVHEIGRASCRERV